MQCSKEKARGAIFYSYTKHINGFAANLDAAAAAEIASEPASASSSSSFFSLRRPLCGNTD
jgi:hypothetical protein